MKDLTKENFIKKFYERVLIPLEKTCSLLDIKPNINYMEEDFSTIINIVLFYPGYYKIKKDDLMIEIYCWQTDIAHDKLLEFYKDFVKHIFNGEIEEHIKDDTDISFFRVSNLNYNTAIFFGGDNFDGFNITYTDE